MNIGYIGLGAMGGALARRLMLSRKMSVFDTRREIIDAFESEGAIGAGDLPVLARESDVIFVCVPTSAVVRDVVFGQGGLAEGLAPGKIVVDQSTGDRTVTRKIAVELDKLGAALVAAPGSGGPVAPLPARSPSCVVGQSGRWRSCVRSWRLSVPASCPAATRATDTCPDGDVCQAEPPDDDAVPLQGGSAVDDGSHRRTCRCGLGAGGVGHAAGARRQAQGARGRCRSRGCQRYRKPRCSARQALPPCRPNSSSPCRRRPVPLRV